LTISCSTETGKAKMLQDTQTDASGEQVASSPADAQVRQEQAAGRLANAEQVPAAKKNRMILMAIVVVSILCVLAIVFCCILGFPVRCTPLLFGGIDDAGLCSGPGPDGEPQGVTNVFPPTAERIYVYVRMRSNTWMNLQFRWYYQDRLVATSTQRHDPGLSYAWMQRAPDQVFPEGKYRVEILLGEWVEKTLNFQVRTPK